MAFALLVANRAQRNLKRLPAADLRRLNDAIEGMRFDPLSGDVVKLKGTGAFRRRVGDYRIIFSVDFKRGAVGILDVLRRTSTTY